MSVTHLKCSFEELNTVGIIKISMVRTILTLSWVTDYVQVSGIHAKKSFVKQSNTVAFKWHGTWL